MNEMPKVPDKGRAAGDPTKPYEQPDIVWEEEYTPTAFGVSCAKQPGNPPCISGPVTS